jgi:hypothetical protein
MTSILKASSFEDFQWRQCNCYGIRPISKRHDCALFPSSWTFAQRPMDIAEGHDGFSVGKMAQQGQAFAQSIPAAGSHDE